MRDLDLFQLALGLQHPWRVDRSEFDPERKRLDIYIDFERGWNVHVSGVRSCRVQGT